MSQLYSLYAPSFLANVGNVIPVSRGRLSCFDSVWCFSVPMRCLCRMFVSPTYKSRSSWNEQEAPWSTMRTLHTAYGETQHKCMRSLHLIFSGKTSIFYRAIRIGHWDMDHTVTKDSCASACHCSASSNYHSYIAKLSSFRRWRFSEWKACEELYSWLHCLDKLRNACQALMIGEGARRLQKDNFHKIWNRSRHRPTGFLHPSRTSRLELWRHAAIRLLAQNLISLGNTNADTTPLKTHGAECCVGWFQFSLGWRHASTEDDEDLMSADRQSVRMLTGSSRARRPPSSPPLPIAAVIASLTAHQDSRMKGAKVPTTQCDDEMTRLWDSRRPSRKLPCIHKR